jgi:dTMP kinase
LASIAEEVAALRGTKAATFKDLLRDPKFSKLLAAQTVSSLGDWIGFSAMAVLALSLGGGGNAGAYAVAGVMVARMLPAILFGPVAGALADRANRKRIMIIADLSRAALYAFVPFVGALWSLYLLSFVIESMSLLWTPARDASLPNLVPKRQLANANSLGLIGTYATLPLGGAIFAVLAGVSIALSARIPYLGTHPESLALWVDGGTFVFSAYMLSRIAFPPPASHRIERLGLSRIGKDIGQGVRFLRESTLASAMTLGIVVAFSAVGAVLALGTIFAKDTLHAGTAGWGVLQTAFGIGMGVGMVGSNKVVQVMEREQVFVLSMTSAAGTLFVLAAMPNLSFAVIVTVILGMFCGATWLNGYVLLQENVEDEFRGRTFAALTVLSRLGLFLSLAVFPVLAGIVGEDHGFFVGGQRLDLSGTRVALWVAGLAVVAASVVTRRGLSHYRLSKPEPLALVPKLKRAPANGLFIAFEGVEGSGKGTQIRLAKEWLEHEGVDVLVTREPGGTDLGEKLRQILLDHDTGHVQPRAETLIFAAARTQLVSTVIRPALAEGKVVICDRYIDSSLAYQGWGRGVGEQDVLTLNVWATQGLFPDMVVLLHLEPETGLLRSLEEPDRIEVETGDFHAKVSDAYLKIAEEHPERFVVIDADDTPDKVHEQVVASLQRVLKDRKGDADVS